MESITDPRLPDAGLHGVVRSVTTAPTSTGVVPAWDPADLPAPTRDLDCARADLDRWGYCLVQDALAPEEVAVLKARLVEQAAGEDAIGLAIHDGGVGENRLRGPNQRVFHLINKGEEFWSIPRHPAALELIAHILGPEFLMSSFTANIAHPGGAAQDLHQDQWYLRNIAKGRIGFPAVANVAWFLDDVDETNGGTCLVPGSHLLDDPDTAIGGPTIAAAGPAGTALVFEGRVLHGTGPNTSDRLRHVLLTYYCLPFMRQQENPYLAVRDDVFERLPEDLRRLMGYAPWYSLGRVYDLRPYPRDEVFRRVPDPPGVMRADGSAG